MTPLTTGRIHTDTPTCNRCGRELTRLICCCHRYAHLFPDIRRQPAQAPAQGRLFEEATSE